MSIKVSIITPSYNCEDYIYETYLCLRQQTYENWEWLVTDDRSSDRTFEILKEISLQDTRVKIEINQKNSGAAVTRNKCLARVKGKYIAFLDSDDLWLNNKLEDQLSYMVENDLSFCFTSFSMIDRKGNSLQIVDSHLSGPVNYEDMLKKKATMGCSTVMLRVHSFQNITMPLLRTGQDYALWLKLLKGGVLAFPLNEVLTRYRVLPGSISRNKFKKAMRQWQIYRELEGISLRYSIFCFCHYAWRAVFRK